MESLRSIRFKLFALISGVVGTLVIVLTWYFPWAHVGQLHDTLQAKAETVVRILGEQARVSIAFADTETAREAFESAAAHVDLAFVGLYRQDGTVLYAQGTGGPTAVTADGAPLARVAGRVRASAPVVSSEGPRGTLVVELSEARIRAQAHEVRTTAALVGLAALVAGMLAAWIVGQSFGRRIAAITAHARRVAGGDLMVPALVDRGRDEIGEMAGAFNVMVGGLRELSGEIVTAAELIESTTGMFLDMAREVETHAATEFTGSMVAGLTELGQYSLQLRGVVGRFDSGGGGAS
jgi:methyl-accepting chemotaxis protein